MVTQLYSKRKDPASIYIITRICFLTPQTIIEMILL
jgi:hypothetical protein